MIQGLSHGERREELTNPTKISCEEYVMYRRKKIGCFRQKARNNMQIDSIDLIRKLPAMIQGNKKFAKVTDGGNYHVGEVEHWCLRFDEIVKAIEDYCEYKETGKYKLSAPVVW